MILSALTKRQPSIMQCCWWDMGEESTFFVGSRETFSTTYAIVPFFTRPFNENFKFLRYCPYDFCFKNNTVVTNPKVFLRAQWHQIRMTGQNKAKINPNDNKVGNLFFFNILIRFQLNYQT